MNKIDKKNKNIGTAIMVVGLIIMAILYFTPGRIGHYIGQVIFIISLLWGGRYYKKAQNKEKAE